MQKAFYLPEAHTDMISAVIGEELGLVGILGVVGLFSMFGYAGLQVAQRAKDNYGKLLVAGLTSLILVQATINLFAVMGLAPLTGVPLPFVSYGNSSLLATLFAVGLILNVARGGTAAAARQTGTAKRRPASGRNWASPSSGAGKLRVVEGGPRRARKESIERCQEAQEWWWRRGEPRVTWCRPWRSPPSFGLAAPRSPSSAPAIGSRRSWCLPPATRSTSSGCAESTGAIRCARAAPALEALGAVGAAAAAIRRRRADVVMGGGGFVAGPAGLAAVLTAHPAGPDRGRQPPRARQPSAGRPRPRGSASPSRLSGREGDRYLLTGRPVPAAVLGADRAQGEGALRDRRRRRAPAW